VYKHRTLNARQLDIDRSVGMSVQPEQRLSQHGHRLNQTAVRQPRQLDFQRRACL
jgi:hypothetical protein